MARNISTAEIYDCGKNRARIMSGHLVETVDDDGNIIRERRSQGLSVKMVSPAGNVVGVSITNGASDRNPNSPYATWVKQTKTDAGFIYYGRCPLLDHQAARFVPKANRDDQPCKDASDVHACKHVGEIISRRQRQQHERATELDRKARETPMARAAEMALENQEKLAKALSGAVKGKNG